MYQSCRQRFILLIQLEWNLDLLWLLIMSAKFAQKCSWKECTKQKVLFFTLIHINIQYLVLIFCPTQKVFTPSSPNGTVRVSNGIPFSCSVYRRNNSVDTFITSSHQGRYCILCEHQSRWNQLLKLKTPQTGVHWSMWTAQSQHAGIGDESQMSSIMKSGSAGEDQWERINKHFCACVTFMCTKM